jgi:hypothetical protein
MFTTQFLPTPKDECIIAFKVYDQCRQQDCLKDLTAVVTIPAGTTSVELVSQPTITSIVTSKIESIIRKGYYDVTITYTFAYTLSFNGGLPVAATSTFIKVVELFGSEGQNVSVYSDLNMFNNLTGLFTLVEANVIPLPGTQLVFTGNLPVPTGVVVTFGLFTIIKLFRLVELLVESKGFCKPEKCNEISEDPCTFFENLDFPFDIFDPPQKKDNGGHCKDKYIPEDI